MADSSAGAGKVQDEPKSKEVLKEGWGHVKRHRSQLEEAPPGQICNNLGIKLLNGSMDYNPLNKIIIYESILTIYRQTNRLRDS